MFKKIISFCISAIAFVPLQAQQSKFPSRVFNDNFDDGSFANWSVINNADNLYFVENGYYELYRRNTKNADVVFCRWENTYDNFEIRLNFKFDKNKNKDQYAGIIFKASKTAALIAEVHQDAKVRMRMITDGKSSFITGSQEEEGWVKFKAIKKDYNSFTIQSDSNNYTLFLNGVKLLSLKQEGFLPGRMGLVIGTDTKIRVDNFEVYTQEKKQEPVAVVDTIIVPPPVEEKVIEKDTAVAVVKPKHGEKQGNTGAKPDTTKKAVTQKPNPNKPNPNNTTRPTVKAPSNAELVAMQRKIDELQMQVNQFRNKMYQEQDRGDSLQSILDNDGKKDYREDNKKLEAENKALIKRDDSLRILMYTYEDVRQALNKSDGSEISLKLAEKLRLEKTANDELDKRNKELEIQNKKLTLRLKNMQTQLTDLKKQQQEQQKQTPKKK